MALHMTKVAFGATSLEDMRGWFATRGAEALLTTRYLPKRHAEMVGGSLYWILKHHLVARSPILRFQEAEGGRTSIVIEPRLIEVRPLPRRAHQGWRNLDAADAPPDLAEGDSAQALPLALASELSRLGLV
ncbi:MAG TPA: DUF1489 domain-containing protein [Novosphingobium sp.]|nr:DUF1489 domain-containing protein [Novosphingobium sp.]